MGRATDLLKQRKHDALVRQVTQPGRFKNDEGKTVLHTLKPEWMPDAPTGPEDPNMPSRGDYLLAPSSHTYGVSKLVDAPVLDHATREITMGKKMQNYVDPERFIAGTLNYPGATGMTGSEKGFSERAIAQYRGEPTPAYGGSTDARAEDRVHHRSTEAVWQGKAEDVTSPEGAEKGPFLDKKTGRQFMSKVNSAGLFARMMGGEKILNPAHHIVDPEHPVYGPSVAGYDTQGNLQVNPEDEGGFGHDQPVQWEGHHRMMAAALTQKAKREAGEKDWQTPVPVDIHFGTPNALSHIPRIKLSDDIMIKRSRRKEALRGMLGLGGGTSDLPTNNPKEPKRVLGSRHAPGTWNSKAY